MIELPFIMFIFSEFFILLDMLNMWLTSIFSYSVACMFILLIGSVTNKSFKFWWSCNLTSVPFMARAFEITSTNAFVVVIYSLIYIWLFAIPWTAAGQASLSLTISQCLLKLMSIELEIPSNCLIICTPCSVLNPKEFLLFFIYFLNFILFLNFTILYWFCQILKWICYRYTCVPHPEPSSLLPPHTIPLGRPRSPAPSIQYRALNLDWRLVSYIYYTCFNVILPNLPTLSLSHRVKFLLFFKVF